MPIDASASVLKLNPLAPLNFGGGGGGGGSLERERLKLMREQFENQKKQQAEQMRLAQIEENGRMARERMTTERMAEQKRLEQEAFTKAERQKAMAEFAKLNASGDIETARAMIPQMTALGMGVDLEGEEGGLPRYRIEMDAAEAAKRAAEGERAPGGTMGAEAIGYGSEDSGVMEEPAGIPSTEDAFARAQEASAFAEQTGQPMRGPDAPDLTGAVPKNVLDMGAIQSQSLARLDPALSGLIDSYPEPYRDSVAQTAAGVRGMGLPATKALEMADKLRGGPDSLIRSEIESGAQAGRFEQTQAAAKDKANVDRYKIGFNTIGKELGAKYNVEDMLTGRNQTKDALAILTNKEDADDHLALALISRRMGERGATTEGDVARALGMSSMSTIDQIKSFLQSRIEGGLSVDQRNSLVGVLKNTAATTDKTFETFLDKVESEASNPDTDPSVAEGLRAYGRATVPADIRAAYQAKKKSKAGGPPADKPARFNMVEDAKKNGPFNMEEDAQRQPMSGRDDPELDAALTEQAGAAGLDPEKIKRIISPESGGDPSAVNAQSGATGLIQFLPEVAKGLGTTTEKIKAMSAAEQVPLVVKYLKDRGITAESSPDDYYMAVAAPGFIGKPDSTVVYPKDSKAWEQNPAWRPKDGGDITVGDIKRYGGGGGGTQAKAASGSDRIRQLLEKARR